MKLSKPKFEQLFEENRLIVSLIGISNIGKTYWSKKLHEISFRHINCDNLIEEKLSPILKKLKYSGIEDVSCWMGQPYDDRYATNQQKYLSIEKEIMKSIFAQIKNKKSQNTVIDTTGSVVHTGKNICAKLRQYSLIVYLEANQNMKEKMFNQYIKKPKPVVFGDIFDPKQNETATQTLQRCYRKLLNLRSVLYSQYADVIIPIESIKKDMNVNQFFSLIKQSL